MNRIAVVLFALIQISCNVALPKEDVNRCYILENEKDSVYLSYKQNGKNISGKLIYKLSEKDKNNGDISGTIDNDIIIADYIFNSEGIQSIRQVTFKIIDNVATEGYGKMEMLNDTLKFVSINDLDYNNSMQLFSVPCSDSLK